jgi:type I restriction enzyme S subunit
MTQEVLGNHKVPAPPLAEQTQIAKFLDYETAKIDALIEKQQQLIALLKEKRQSVISHAVTKGLNPDAPMRDSGVEWLGEVPAHWDPSRLKFLVSHVVDCHHSTPGYDPDAAFPALRTADVNPGRLDVEGARRVHLEEYEERISRLRPEPGDIVYSREGERWGIAAPVPAGAHVCLAQRVMLFRVNELVESGFLMWALNSVGVYNQLAVDVVGATSPHVNIGDIREVWVAVPPLAEQAEIVGQIQGALQKLDGLDGQCAQVITTLQERRTALISAAVTGKIDVRDWQRPEHEPETEVA